MTYEAAKEVIVEKACSSLKLSDSMAVSSNPMAVSSDSMAASSDLTSALKMVQHPQAGIIWCHEHAHLIPTV